MKDHRILSKKEMKAVIGGKVQNNLFCPNGGPKLTIVSDSDATFGTQYLDAFQSGTGYPTQRMYITDGTTTLYCPQTQQTQSA